MKLEYLDTSKIFSLNELRVEVSKQVSSSLYIVISQRDYDRLMLYESRTFLDADASPITERSNFEVIPNSNMDLIIFVKERYKNET